MLNLLSIIPYVVVGIVLTTTGVTVDTWQLWVVLVSMFINGIICFVSGVKAPNI